MESNIDDMSLEDIFRLVSETHPLPPPVEFRAYYNDAGKVTAYTCENLSGKYVVIDSGTYHEARPEWMVVDGELRKVQSGIITAKYIEAEDGVKTTAEDMSIIVDDSYTGPTKFWKIEIYE